jgi:membrane associated rhomboid family serine protease
VLPLQDVIPPRTTPIVTLTFIAIHAAVWAAAYAAGDWAVAGAITRDNVAPFLVNLLFLWLFGENVEDRLGRARFVALYVLCGALTVVPLASHDVALVPLIGTSGGTTGVLGAYFVLFPRSLILTLVPLPSVLVEVPAVSFLGVWVVVQVLSLLTSGLEIGMTVWVERVVAAHAAGFVAGAVLCMAMRRPERARVEWWGP